MAAGKKVRIRMYNVGFGDAFLLTIPTSKGERRILFDCGSISAGPRPMKEVVRDIIEACSDDNGKASIDVVVCTHRHRDHVSGFADKAWADVTVSEVWMPWTEDPRDPVARRIRNKQAGLAFALASGPALAAMNLQASMRDAEPPTGVSGLAELTLNALSNEAAMETLHNGFSGEPERLFLPQADAHKGPTRTFTTPVLPGVKIHILGPSRDEEIIADMDPPKGESYLRLLRQGAGNEGGECRPVSEEFEIDANAWNFATQTPGLLADNEPDIIAASTSGDDIAAAAALDKAVNGTSLMLMLEFGGRFMLFPGDAQWGTWNAALDDEEWGEMLTKTGFYKVGHHGSHNATPKRFVEGDIRKGLVAMISTKHREDTWPNIPRIPLLEAMTGKEAVVARSDEAEEALRRIFKRHEDHYIDTEI